MDLSYCKEQSEIIRRIAERGKCKAEKDLDVQSSQFDYVDLFVHLLDENQRLYNELQKS